MKATRKIVNNNKGFITFLLVSFFLIGGLAKGLVSDVVLQDVKQKSQASLKYVLCAEDDKGSSLSFLDQLKDADGNDAEFTFFGNFISPRVFIAIPEPGLQRLTFVKMRLQCHYMTCIATGNSLFLK